MRKLDLLDAVEIKKEAAKLVRINTEIRYGQAIFIATQEKFPKAANKLRSTNVDCYYDDSKVTKFLCALDGMNAE